MEESDKKALEQQYVASYTYSRGQKLTAGIVTIAVLAGMIIGLALLVLSIINHITG